ncbi:hypothetical protein Lesp02_62880 [Lentzea sp. NBRC 105346]|uniref:hypothetical protein n=1 Tax=Lentzea sp. NBRC 105346 TaxID=3032205 RepID=UPI0024A30865|nr:hypothetical protein [Lentzea sp. NBRC 105346]GLZ34101.1 hypothetical protein Lesp02_62880 [Lentzea sp. NBRC 105346]
MVTLIDIETALAEFPELQHLIDLVHAGWVFLPSMADGVVTAMHGVRMWPGGWTDAVRVRHTTDAKALRSDYDGGLVWERSGSLADVVHALIMLPPPGTPTAPRLVTGTAPKPWMP